MAEPEYLTVTALTQYLKRKFDFDPYLTRVAVSGEISNFRLRPNHQYFSLKDDGAKISAVMFKSAFAKLKFQPEEGMKVLAVGRVTLYPNSGNYQIVIDRMEPDGVGALYQAYEQLKAKLEAEGLFAKNQRPLRQFPKRVAVITSPSGAVIQDIRTTVARRYPILQLVLFPAQVQGDTAAAGIRAQLKRVRALGPFDALIIGRGGGSIEDLWPFNDEALARDLADMPMPVVASVGHETDFTIVDYVADKRAATPTAAAELVTPVPLVDALSRLSEDRTRLAAALMRTLQALTQRLHRVQQSVVLTQPERLYDQYLQRVDQLVARRNVAMQTILQQQAHRLAMAQASLAPRQLAVRVATTQATVRADRGRLDRAIQTLVATKRQQLAAAELALDHLSPLKILGRGYAYVTAPDGHMLTRVADYAVGATAEIHAADGTVNVTINERKQTNG